MRQQEAGGDLTARSCVSVVIPVRNRPASIVNAINSVLGQSVPPLRIVVVDDGSTDATTREVQRLAKGAVNLRVITIPHSGPASARNAGLEALDVALHPAHGMPDAGDNNLIAFLDSDDIWPPDFLLRAQQRLVGSPELGFVVADRLECFHRSGPRLHSASCFDTDPWGALLRQSPQIMSCAVFRRRVLADRPFPAGCFIGEDSALLIRLLADGAKSAWIAGEPVVATRIPPGDQDRLTSRDRSSREKLQDRLGSAEIYAAALAASTAAIPGRLADRLLAARWVAVLGHGLAARDDQGVGRALSELWRCGARATALGLFDHYQVLTDRGGARQPPIAKAELRP
jgi:hypothetical protein